MGKLGDGMILDNEREDRSDIIRNRRARCKLTRQQWYSRWDAIQWEFRQPWENGTVKNMSQAESSWNFYHFHNHNKLRAIKGTR